VKCEGALLSKM